jgi:hypothetical protein
MSNKDYTMTARKLHHKDISDTASTHLGRPGDIWFDPASTVLRTYNGSPGGKTLGGAGSITSGDVITALGYTPYNSTNPSGYTNNTGTVTSIGGTGTVSGLSLSGLVTSSGSLTLGGTLTLTSGQITGALGYTPVSNAIQIFSSTVITVSTTTTYNLSTTNSYNILDVTAGGLTATLNMPTTPANGQTATIAIINNTVTLAQGTGTVNPSFAGGYVLGTTFTYIYRSITSTWYRVA